MMTIGNDDQSHEYRVCNSRSKRWGIDGYSWSSHDYLANPHLAADFWAIQALTTK